MKKEFTVTVVRVAYSYVDVVVYANDEENAKEQAIECAMNSYLTESQSEYTAQIVEEKTINQ